MMRWLMVAAVACFGIAIGCEAQPTTVFGADAAIWTNAGLLAVALDFLVGPRLYGRAEP
jgi:hypothetical protein